MSGDGTAPNPTGRSTTRVAGPSRGGATVHVKFRTKITSIQLTKLTYRTDHHLMKDNHTDWLNTGALFAKPEWTLGDSCNPVSHSKSQPIAVDLEFAVEPANADETIADVIGKAPLVQGLYNHLYYTFAATNKKFKGGTVTVSATLRTIPPDLVEILSGDITWSVKTRDDGPFDAGSSTLHTIYCTMNTPVSAPGLEAGITEKRVRRSVTLVGQAKPDDPHAIASYLQNLFPGYTLKPSTDPDLVKFHHPRFFADPNQNEVESGAGAWPASDFFQKKAECQAIVRFVRATMLQVGCPGVMAVVVVWADPNHHGKVMQGDWDAGVAGLQDVSKTVNGKTWSAALLDEEVEEGDVVDPEDVGFNNFEACLKLTYGGKTMYYGGGSGDYATKEEVISGSFYSLCWFSVITTADGQTKNRIEKIVKSYQ